MKRIVFDNDGRYKKAIIFDGKSYCLLDYDDKLTIKGNTLKGRSNENFLNEFIKNGIWHVLREEPEHIRQEYDRWYKRIEDKKMKASEVSKRESINMSLETYRNKISAGQNPIATYEAALQADRNYMKGDTITTWIEEPEPVKKEYKTKPDEWIIPKNVSSYENIRLAENFNGNIYRHHYHSRLETAVKRFLVVLGLETFQLLFPEMTIYKSEKRKLIPILGLENFHKHYPDYNWTKNGYEKLSKKDKELFDIYINNDYISKEYKSLTQTQ